MILLALLSTFGLLVGSACGDSCLNAMAAEIVFICSSARCCPPLLHAFRLSSFPFSLTPLVSPGRLSHDLFIALLSFFSAPDQNVLDALLPDLLKCLPLLHTLTPLLHTPLAQPSCVLVDLLGRFPHHVRRVSFLQNSSCTHCLVNALIVRAHLRLVFCAYAQPVLQSVSPRSLSHPPLLPLRQDQCSSALSVLGPLGQTHLCLHNSAHTLCICEDSVYILVYAVHCIDVARHVSSVDGVQCMSGKMVVWCETPSTTMCRVSVCFRPGCPLRLFCTRRPR
eukprot:jgi/Antlo1/1043/1104